MFFDKTGMKGYITKEEHEEFTKRMDAENKRLSHRIELLEKLDEKIYQIIASIEKMSTNVEHMLKNQERQEKRLESHDTRIDSLENKDSKKWNNIMEHMWKALAVAVVGYFLAKMGMQ